MERNFYSRPCGRGDTSGAYTDGTDQVFLLTPLREGRPELGTLKSELKLFLLTPLREGRRKPSHSLCNH